LKQIFRSATLLYFSLFAIVGCTSPRNQAESSRTPEEFLAAVKSVISHGDMSDYRLLEAKFMVTLTPQPAKNSFDLKTAEFIGTTQDFSILQKSNEITINNGRTLPYYTFFRPVGRNFERAIFSEELNNEALCITPEQVVKAFGATRPAGGPDSADVNYRYVYKGVNIIELVFSFDSPRSSCANKILFFQNRMR
jgi:hypothetical protein